MTKSYALLIAFCSFTLLPAFAAPLPATTLYDNTSLTYTTGLETTQSSLVGQVAGQSFVTDTLGVATDLKVEVERTATKSGIVEAFFLYGNAGGEPDFTDLLGSLGLISDAQINTLNIFVLKDLGTSLASITLAPSTEYWVVMVEGACSITCATNDISWGVTSDVVDGTGVSNQAMATPTAINTFTSDNTRRMGMMITYTTPVPEPAAIGYLLSGIVGLAWMQHRRRTRPTAS